MTTDEKYIVFKREDWVAIWGEDFPGMDGVHQVQDQAEHTALTDAVVIRKQDVFAGPALHAYASSIQTTIEVLEAEQVVLGGSTVRRLYEIRDYFFQQALEADDVRTKRVPD